MLSSIYVKCILLSLLLVVQGWGSPVGRLRHEQNDLTDVGNHVANRVAPHLQEPKLPLPLPTPQELEAIKKVAQILIMLGEQVIPSIIGDTSANCCDDVALDVPSDPVDATIM